MVSMGEMETRQNPCLFLELLLQFQLLACVFLEMPEMNNLPPKHFPATSRNSGKLPDCWMLWNTDTMAWIGITLPENVGTDKPYKHYGSWNLKVAIPKRNYKTFPAPPYKELFQKLISWFLICLCHPSVVFSISFPWTLLFTVNQGLIWTKIWKWK